MIDLYIIQNKDMMCIETLCLNIPVSNSDRDVVRNVTQNSQMDVSVESHKYTLLVDIMEFI